MIETTQHGVLKRPRFLLGLGIAILSICGIVLAAGTLISLQQTPDKLLNAFRKQHGQILSKAGVPTDLIESFVTGETFPTNVIADLTEEQRRVVSMAQEALPAMATAVRQAAAESRTKSRWGIAISSVLLLFSIVLLGSESRRAKMRQTNGRTSG
jgi:hypothetical protein